MVVSGWLPAGAGVMATPNLPLPGRGRVGRRTLVAMSITSTKKLPSARYARGPSGVMATPFTPDGSRAYLAEGSFFVEFIDIATNVLRSTLPLPGKGRFGVAITPAPAGNQPDTTIASGPTGLTRSTSATFTFSATDPGATFACQLDAGGFVACTSPITYSNLSEG